MECPAHSTISTRDRRRWNATGIPPYGAGLSLGQSLRLTRLSLTQFRNYAALVWRPGARISVIHGPNGSGKTNLLEAVSLLTPGRGLRGARAAEFPRQARDASGKPSIAESWAVAGRFITPDGETTIGTGSAPLPGPAGRAAESRVPDRRAFRLDGAPPRNQAEITAKVAAIWLTPQMDRLFLEGAAGRRRFLDRLVWTLEPTHTRELAAHDTAVAERNRLLASPRPDPAWLDGLEDAIARHATAATASRMTLVSTLNATLAGGAADPFPPARLSLLCPIAERLAEAPALAVEDWLRRALAAARAEDARAGTTALSTRRADMGLEDAATGLTAALASTGQQKALLVSVVLGHAALVAETRGFGPLLLLDEPAVHLDATRREALFATLARLPCQALLTGVDAGIFRPLHGIAEGLITGDDLLRLDDAFPPPNPGLGTL